MPSPSTLPPNFSWVIADKLAALARPETSAHYRYLLDNGIKHLICLLENKTPSLDIGPELVLHHIAVIDFSPPSPDQIEQFLSIVDQADTTGEGVAVHCMHGQGRTGTMLACYLVRTRGMTSQDAIDEIRKLRTGSIETLGQEEAIHQFYQRNLKSK